MLILIRRAGETLNVGDDVALIVLRVQGNQVRIGIKALKNITAHREENYRRIQIKSVQGHLDSFMFDSWIYPEQSYSLAQMITSLSASCNIRHS